MRGSQYSMRKSYNSIRCSVRGIREWILTNGQYRANERKELFIVYWWWMMLPISDISVSFPPTFLSASRHSFFPHFLLLTVDRQTLLARLFYTYKRMKERTWQKDFFSKRMSTATTACNYGDIRCFILASTRLRSRRVTAMSGEPHALSLAKGIYNVHN